MGVLFSHKFKLQLGVLLGIQGQECWSRELGRKEPRHLWCQLPFPKLHLRTEHGHSITIPQPLHREEWFLTAAVEILSSLESAPARSGVCVLYQWSDIPSPSLLSPVAVA